MEDAPAMRLNLFAQLALPGLAFVVATALGRLVAVDGLGEAATLGQLAFALTLVAVLLYGSPART
jgi:hypothetical protein